MLSKIASTIQQSANAVSANTFLGRDKCLKCLPSPFTYSCQTICKTLDSFMNWSCRKLSDVFSSATCNSETVLDFGWRFQNSFLRRSQTWYLHSIQIWRVIRCPLFISSICGQFSQRQCWETRAMRAEPMYLGAWLIPGNVCYSHARNILSNFIALNQTVWE